MQITPLIIAVLIVLSLGTLNFWFDQKKRRRETFFMLLNDYLRKHPEFIFQTRHGKSKVSFLGSADIERCCETLFAFCEQNGYVVEKSVIINSQIHKFRVSGKGFREKFRIERYGPVSSQGEYGFLLQ